jgi:hypothetical protein
MSLLILLVGLVTAREFLARTKGRPLALQPAEVAEQSSITVKEPRVPVIAGTWCEQIWDPTTHMSREEWAQACRRVEAQSQTEGR